MDNKIDVKPNKISLDSLEKFVNLQFSDYCPPNLEEFLIIGKRKHESLTFPIIEIIQNSISKQLQQKLHQQSIIYIHSGTIQLHKKQSNSLRYTRQIEYKQSSFFTLVNYKNISKSEPEFYRLKFKTKVSFSFIPINPKYNYFWMKYSWEKKLLISKIFLNGENQIQILRKKNKFRDFMHHFESESFRRQTRIVSQGKINDRLYIISKGEAKLYKQLTLNNDHKGDVKKNIEIVYLRQGSVIGGQLFLVNNKQVQMIINNHKAKEKQSNQTINQMSRQEGDQQIYQGNEESNGKRQKLRQFRKTIKVKQGGYQLYHPADNISNYTIIAESANVQVLYIDLKKLVHLINERYKVNFIKLYSSFYITSLRRTHQKMTDALLNQKSKVKNQMDNIELIVAKAYSSHQGKREIQSQQTEGIIMKKSSLGIMTSPLKQFKSQDVWLNQNNTIQTKASLLIRQNRPFVNYKQKIEKLIESKLNNIKAENNPQMDVISSDLCNIFMKNSQGRSQDIQKRNQIIEKKVKIVEERGGWKQGWNKIKPEGMKINLKRRSQSVQNLNYLQGLNVQEYADKVKMRCTHKIHQTNKIKQQFMKIKSECPLCQCYDGFQSFKTDRDRMTQTQTGFRKSLLKTGQGWGKTSKVQMDQESLQSVYNKMKFLSERSKERYNHNLHILQLSRNKTKLERRRTAPRMF